MGVIEKQSIQNIANAIRNRNGLTTLYKPREMDEAILNLYSTTKVNNMLDYILPCHEEEATDFTIKYADSDRPCSISELQGNTTQNGTPTPTTPIPIYTVSGDNEVVVCGENMLPQDKYITSRTINGITYTNNGDGTFSLSGTATATTSLVIIPVGNLNFIESGQPYYLYSSQPYNNMTFNMCIFMQENGTNKYLIANSTYTPNGTLSNIRMQFYIQSGKTVNAENIQMMLVKGSTAPTSYKPYTGNSYRVDLGGKNKFNYQYSQLRNINRATTSEETNGFKLTSTGVAGYGFASLPIDNNLLGKQVTISCNSSGNKTPSARLFYHNSSGSLTSNIGAFWTTNNAHTVTLPSTLPSGSTGIDIVFYISQGNNAEGDYVTFTNIQIELGTVATPYSPHVSNPIELCKIGSYVDKLKRAEGKQLFDKDNMNKLDAYFESNNVITASNYNRIFYIECEPNTTYTIAQNPSTSPISNHLLQVATSSVLPEIGVECTSNHNIGGDTSYTMTTNADAKYLVFRIRSGDDIDSYLSTIMINYGSTALPYEPYGNNWYIEKNIGKVVLNGSESWSINRSGTANWYYYANISSIAIITDSTSSNTLCDHYAWGSVGVSNINTGYYIVKNDGQVRIRYGTEDTVANYKTWLGNNNVTLYYALATPTTETITNENLLEQLNNIQNIQLIENLCYVDWVGEEKPKMKLFCYLDKDKIIEEITG